MSDLVCPVCKCDSYFNPNIKIYTSPCFHRICVTCLYRIFQQGYSPCPECGTLLRRINYISSTFEDIEVEKELKFRKLMNNYFYRNEDEFEDEIEYNNYLEEYENALFNLLDLNHENLVKERINILRSTSGILIPRKSIKEQPNEQEIKKTKMEDNWCIFKEKIGENYTFDEEIIIPRGFILPYKPAALKREEVMGFIFYSLNEIITHQGTSNA